MALNVKIIEMVAKIQRHRKTRVRRSIDLLFANYIPTMDDCIRDMRVYLKKVQKKLEEENRNYRN